MTTSIPRISHLGICVTDIGRSMDFYCGALGFVPGEVMEISSGLDGIMELTGVSLRSQFIRRPDGFALELLELRSPEPFGPRERRPLNQFGLTHLSFYVESLEASMAELVRWCRVRRHPHVLAVVRRQARVLQRSGWRSYRADAAQLA
ncbi:MAG: VOC family protein [Pseudomonadota bacterium]|jgi:catechol 2,3-dioxygenase-like lactoylglutathione lyase family enzyme